MAGGSCQSFPFAGRRGAGGAAGGARRTGAGRRNPRRPGRHLNHRGYRSSPEGPLPDGRTCPSDRSLPKLVRDASPKIRGPVARETPALALRHCCHATRSPKSSPAAAGQPTATPIPKAPLHLSIAGDFLDYEVKRGAAATLCRFLARRQSYVRRPPDYACRPKSARSVLPAHAHADVEGVDVGAAPHFRQLARQLKLDGGR